MRPKWLKLAPAALLAFSLTACDSLSDLDDLEVINQNAPDTERALGTPGDIESLIGSGYQIYHAAQFWEASMILGTIADEFTSSWANFGMNDFSGEPRTAWNNSPSYSRRTSTERPWYSAYEAISAMYDGLVAINEDEGPLCDAIDCARAFTFAKLVQGVAHGWLALMFDSAFVLDETVDLETTTLELLPYPNVMDAAMGFLQEAISSPAWQETTINQAWINGNAFTQQEIVRLAHSYMARFIAQVARTPAERAAQDWGAVITHVDAGITADLVIEGDSYNLWDDFQKDLAELPDDTWGRADYHTIGYTEFGQGKGYDAWLATPFAQRDRFDLDIPDRRITPGPPPHTPFASDGLDFGHWGFTTLPAARGTYHWSSYGHHRYSDYPLNAGDAPLTWMKVTEMQLYKAEALIRLSQAGAATIINNTRVTRGQLPPVADSDPDIMEQLMYEWKIENFNLCGGCAYFNSRGWDAHNPTTTHYFGLLEGTQVHFAPPGKELEVLDKILYTYGGVGNDLGGTLQPSSADGVSRDGRGVPARLVYRFNEFNSVKEKLDYIRGQRSKPSGVATLARYVH